VSEYAKLQFSGLKPNNRKAANIITWKKIQETHMVTLIQIRNRIKKVKIIWAHPRLYKNQTEIQIRWQGLWLI
jgi:hypothetical protein